MELRLTKKELSIVLRSIENLCDHRERFFDDRIDHLSKTLTDHIEKQTENSRQLIAEQAELNRQVGDEISGRIDSLSEKLHTRINDLSEQVEEIGNTVEDIYGIVEDNGTSDDDDDDYPDDDDYYVEKLISENGDLVIAMVTDDNEDILAYDIIRNEKNVPVDDLEAVENLYDAIDDERCNDRVELCGYDFCDVAEACDFMTDLATVSRRIDQDAKTDQYVVYLAKFDTNGRRVLAVVTNDIAGDRAFVVVGYRFVDGAFVDTESQCCGKILNGVNRSITKAIIDGTAMTLHVGCERECVEVAKAWVGDCHLSDGKDAAYGLYLMVSSDKKFAALTVADTNDKNNVIEMSMLRNETDDEIRTEDLIAKFGDWMDSDSISGALGNYVYQIGTGDLASCTDMLVHTKERFATSKPDHFDEVLDEYAKEYPMVNIEFPDELVATRYGLYEYNYHTKSNGDLKCTFIYDGETNKITDSVNRPGNVSVKKLISMSTLIRSFRELTDAQESFYNLNQIDKNALDAFVNTTKQNSEAVATDDAAGKMCVLSMINVDAGEVFYVRNADGEIVSYDVVRRNPDDQRDIYEFIDANASVAEECGREHDPDILAIRMRIMADDARKGIN